MVKKIIAEGQIVEIDFDKAEIAVKELDEEESTTYYFFNDNIKDALDGYFEGGTDVKVWVSINSNNRTVYKVEPL